MLPDRFRFNFLLKSDVFPFQPMGARLNDLATRLYDELIEKLFIKGILINVFEVSFLLRTFISKLFVSPKPILPDLPCPGAPNTNPWYLDLISVSPSSFFCTSWKIPNFESEKSGL